MTILDDENSTVDGGIAPGGVTGWSDLYDAAMAATISGQNVFSRAEQREDAWDRRIDEVFAATGQRMTNPFRIDSLGAIETGMERPDPFADAMADLQRLTEQHPDKAAQIRAGVSPDEDAYAKVQADQQRQGSALSRYRGSFPRWTASFAGGFVGAMQDPANAASMLVGGGGAAPGIKGLAWSAIRQGAINAGVETAMQPAVASWLNEAGVGYSHRDFVDNVSMAFVFGAGFDAVPRGISRGYRAARGQVPVLDADGNVSGWQSPEDALDAAARKSTSEKLRRAADSDTQALRELADEVGLRDDAETQALFDELDDIDATTPRYADGVDPHEVARVEAQAERHFMDPAEPLYREPQPLPPPRMPEELPQYVRDIRAALEDGRASVPEMAAMIRRTPEALDSTMAPLPGPLADARAIASLSEPAFRMVERGDATPAHAALVARAVEKPADQAAVLADLGKAKPRNAAEARLMVGALTPPEPEPRAPEGGRIDDPRGPEAEAQEKALEADIERGAANFGGDLPRWLRASGRAAEIGAIADRAEKAADIAKIPIAEVVNRPSDPLPSAAAMTREPPRAAPPPTQPGARRWGDRITESAMLDAIRSGRRGYWTDLADVRARLGNPDDASWRAAVQDMARSGSVRLTLEEDQASLWRSGGEARRAAAVSYGGEDMHFIAVEQRGDAAPSPAPPTTPPRKKIIVVDERKFVKPSDPRPRDANGNLAPPPDYQPRGERDTEFEGRGNFTEDVRAVAQALRINGVAGVKDLLAGMAPQRSRDVASRLAGDVVAKWDDMTERQRTALIAGRTMRRLAETTDDAERQAKLLKRADELEVIALPPDNPVDWIRAAAFGAKVQKPKIAHPTVANLKLETEPDGTVLMYRGQPAKERGLGQYAGRIWTTDLARALRNAPTGELYVVRVKPDELAQASPSSSRAGKVRADETRFTLSAELAKRGKRYDADAELMAKARQAAVGGVTNPGRGDVTETVRKRADKLTAGAIFQRLSAAADQPAVPHPAQPKMMLLQEADGHVLMFQGRNPEKTIGSTGERIYTTDVERAIRGANGGEVRVIRIPVDELEKARPRSGVNGRIDPAESVFVLDRDLAWKAELVEGAPDMLQAAVRQALELAPEAKYTRSMDDVEALIRLREVIEECKP